FVEVRVRTSAKAVLHIWRFYPLTLGFYTSHVAWAYLDADGNKPDYDTASFGYVSLSLENEDIGKIEAYKNAEGTLTVPGSYTPYIKGVGLGEAVVNGTKDFPIKQDQEEKGIWFDPYDKESGQAIDFRGAADAGGLNGKTVTWTFGESAGFPSGSAVVPNFPGTASQLENGVPYIELTRDSANAVTGFKVSIIRPSDPSTPVELPNTKLRVRFARPGGGWDVMQEWTDCDGQERTITLNTPIPAADFQAADMVLRNSVLGAKYRWRFYTATATAGGIKRLTEKFNDAAQAAVDENMEANPTQTTDVLGTIAASGLSDEDINSLTFEDITKAVENKVSEDKDAETEAASANKSVADAKVPAGTDLLVSSDNAAFKAANEGLTVKPKFVLPEAATDITTLPGGAAPQTGVTFGTAITLLSEQMAKIEDLLDQVSPDLASADGANGSGVVIASVLPEMTPGTSGFFPMKVNLRNLTPGRKLKFWPRASSMVGTASVANVAAVSLAEEPKEGDYYFLDQNGNATAKVSGDAAVMYVVPYLEKGADYSGAFITADASETDIEALKALEVSANPDSSAPASDKGSGGCDAGFGLAGMLALAAGLLTLRKK
ncbi:MAG: hypothetical protein IJR68_12190, partial [Fretibacterium sp.]|nr:hypothetical protein [Fretibacterium sp.]